MKNVLKGLLSVVENLAESHTFRSESTAAKVQQTLADTRTAIDGLAELDDAPAAAEPAKTPETPAPAVAAEAQVPVTEPPSVTGTEATSA